MFIPLSLIIGQLSLSLIMLLNEIAVAEHKFVKYVCETGHCYTGTTHVASS